jgi:hypothetical protein
MSRLSLVRHGTPGPRSPVKLVYVAAAPFIESPWRNLNPPSILRASQGKGRFASSIFPMQRTTGWTWLQKLGRAFGWVAAWAWTIIAGIGGLGLIITQGPLPLTNGWFALFSAISACPPTAWLLKKYGGIRLSGWARFAIAFLIIVLGRLCLKIEGRGSSLPHWT